LGRSNCLVTGGGEVVDELLVRVWDAQTLEASWRAAKPSLPDVDLTRTATGLSGTVTNTTPDALRNATLLFGGRATDLGTLRPGDAVEPGSRPSQRLSDYARHCVPSDLQRGGPYSPGYYPWGRELHREDADAAARWVSLFAFQGGTGAFRRWSPLADEGSSGQTDEGGPRQSALFDLTRDLELGGLQGTADAVLLYSVDRSFVGILLSGRQPKSWDRSLVRLRVPVANSGQREGGSR
jgi:hypothetical protein